MARILVESLMVRYPLAGMMSWTLQYLIGLDRLGHDVVLVERADHEYACFDPSTGENGVDCNFGTHAVDRLLRSVGLSGRWAFVDVRGSVHGMSAHLLDEYFRTADVFVAMTFEECWHDRAARIPCRVLLDGDPGIRQVVHRQAARAEQAIPTYDAYFTSALNIGAPNCTIPDDGITWHPLPHPVATEMFEFSIPPIEGPLTTIMNWRSYDVVEEDGVRYGQKDVELLKFIDLPGHVEQPLEIAMAGDAPLEILMAAGWSVVDAHAITLQSARFHSYIRGSLGEFSVCKNAYVQTRSGWFSDRSAAYLATGRPVILQDTGFSSHLPCGTGLLAFSTIETAVDAIQRVHREPESHARAAREIACTELEATRVMARMMDILP